MSPGPDWDAPAPVAAPSDPTEAVLMPLVRGWAWIVLGAIVGGFLGLLSGLQQRNAYESTGKLLVRSGAREEATPEQRIAGIERAGALSSREALANEIHLLTSPTIYEQVVRKVSAAELLSPYDPSTVDDENTALHVRLLHKLQARWFAEEDDGDDGHEIDACSRCVAVAHEVLLSGMTLLPEIGSSVITIRYRAHSPALAQKVVAAFLEVAVQHHQQVFAQEATERFLELQVREALDASSTADDDLARHRIDCDIFDLDGKRAAVLAEVNELETALHRDNVQIAELSKRLEALRSELEGETPFLTQKVERPPVPNATRMALLANRQEFSRQIVELRGRGGQTVAELDRQVRALQQEIDAIDQQLLTVPDVTEVAPAVQEVPNPRYARLVERRDQAREDLAGVTAASAKRLERRTELRQELRRLQECEPQLRALEDGAQRARSRSESLMLARDKQAAMNLLDEANMTNLRRLQDASYSAMKVAPRRGKLFAVGVLLGGLAGAAGIFLRRFLGRRVEDPRALLAWLPAGSAVLVVPDEGRRRSLLGRRRAATPGAPAR